MDADGESDTTSLDRIGSAEVVSGIEFTESFGESLSQTLDLDTWTPGAELGTLYARLEQEVAEAVSQESEMRQAIRCKVFPQLKHHPNAPKEAGVYQAGQKDIKQVHRSILFNGALEACDGNSNVHDTLPLTITQLGISLVSYSGEQGSWVHRLFRRDLRTRVQDPVEEALTVLEKRNERGGLGIDDRTSRLSILARRGIMTFAERSVLLSKSNKPWRMGHGQPAPYELLTGAGDGTMELLHKSLDVLEELLGAHKRFVFVPSSPANRVFLTIGEALRPLEYAIVDTLDRHVEDIVAKGHLRGRHFKRALGFVHETASHLVVGVYRASSISPTYLFYAHEEYAHEAALIAMADSVLQEHRGFPMLIDLADTVCRGALGLSGFAPSVETAYIDAGAPFRYQGERATRRM